MSGTFRILENSWLRFIWEEDPNNLQTDKNRLYENYTYPSRYFDRISWPLVQQGDDKWHQFRTDYTNIVTELYDCDGNVTTLTNDTITVEDDYTYYQVDLTTTSLDGFYYIRHSMETDAGKPIVHFRSDWFYAKETHDNTMLIEYYGANANEIPMQWGDKSQELRVVAHIADWEGGNLITSLRGSDNNLNTIVADALNTRYLVVDNINEYVAEKLNIASTHDQFIVNSQEFGTEEAISFGDRLGDTLTYTFKVKLEEKDYLNYASDPVLSGDIPEVTRKGIRFSTGKAFRFSTGKAISFE